MTKRRTLIVGLVVLTLVATATIGVLTDIFAPIAKWFHDSATATLPIEDPEYMYNRALEYDQDGNSTYALAAARRAVAIKPDYAEARRFIAAKDLKDLDFVDAAAQCNGLLANDPNDATALLGLASAYNGLGKPAQSEAIYRKLMDNLVNTEDIRDAAQRQLNVLQSKSADAAGGAKTSANP